MDEEKPQRASRSTKIKSKKYCPTDSSSENNNSQSEDSSSSRSRSRSRSTASNKSEHSNKSDSRSSSVEAKPPIPVDETIHELDKQTELTKQKSRTPSPNDSMENTQTLVIDEDSQKVAAEKPKKKEKKNKKRKHEKKQTQTESLEDMTKMIEDRLADLKSDDSKAKEEALHRKKEMKQIKEVIAKKKALDKAKKAQEKETKGKKTTKRQHEHEVSPQRKVIEDERAEQQEKAEIKPERKVIFAEDNKAKKELISTEIVMQISPEDKFSDSDDDAKEEEAPVVTKHYLIDALNKQKEHCAMLEKYNKDLHESVKKHTFEKKVGIDKATKESILLIKEVSMKSMDLAVRKLRPCPAYNSNTCTESEPESDKFGIYCNRIVGDKITKFLHCCCFCRSKTGRINKHPAIECILAQKYKHLFMEEDKLAETAQPEKAKRKFTPITAPSNDNEAKKLKKEVPTNTTHATTSSSVTGILKQPKPTVENENKQGGDERPAWVSDLISIFQPLTKAVKESNERAGRSFTRGRGRGRGRGRARSKSVDRSGN